MTAPGRGIIAPDQDGGYAPYVGTSLSTPQVAAMAVMVKQMDSSVNYTIVPGKIKNTFNFTDGVNNMTGIVEIVKIDDKPVAITIWGDIGGKNTDLEKFTSQLEEVNKLNKLEPVDTSTL